MNYKQTTMTPNAVFDTYLTSLSEKELKLLLIIIRQTVGWKTKDGKRKMRDYISRKYFISKTGLSAKSVSVGISLLLKKNLIAIETNSGRPIQTSEERKWRCHKYYRCLLFDNNEDVKSSLSNQSILPPTKLTSTKLNTPQTKKNTSLQRLSDKQRYLQILRDRGG